MCPHRVTERRGLLPRTHTITRAAVGRSVEPYDAVDLVGAGGVRLSGFRKTEPTYEQNKKKDKTQSLELGSVPMMFRSCGCGVIVVVVV